MATCSVICRTEEISAYFIKRFKTFVLVKVVSPNTLDESPACEYYVGGNLRRAFSIPSLHRLPASSGHLLFINHLVYVLSIIYSAVRLGEKFDLFIGVGPYYNLAGLLLKSIGFVKHVLYYAGDYFPPAENVSVTLNFKLKLFHFLDSLSVRYSDGVWSSLESVRVAHSKSGVFPPKGSVDFVAPLGLKKHRDVFVTTKRGHELVYFGSVQRGKGIELLIEVMPELIRKVPDILVNIVGTGSMEDEFRGLVKNHCFERYFNFFGYVPNGQRLDEILSRSSLGLALFDPRDGEFSQYVNPGKVMEYISRGIPPVISKNIPIASDISEMRGGYCIDYSPASLCSAIISAFSNEGELSEIKHNLEAVANKYEWESILSGVYDIICKRFGKI